ncbi:hypothetical protein bcgnr5390_11000 [Bacillus luti]|nr:hypothetical protein BC2903_29910 [Bacillus cereus]
MKNNNNNVRTMDFVGVDDHDRPVYKCIETERLFKDITLGSANPALYSCNNDFDGEPGSPINKDLTINFINKPEQVNPQDRFNYQLLSRLQGDCKYYLGNGKRNVNYLEGNNVKEHIEKMKELHNSFSDSKKPEWLTFEEILKYEESMSNNK